MKTKVIGKRLAFVIRRPRLKETMMIAQKLNDNGVLSGIDSRVEPRSRGQRKS